MSKPAVHLICNAHLDPVWQWRFEEGAAEALATFRTAVRLLREHPDLIFCHNEAVLYRWAERYDPALFMEIERLVAVGRWAVSGGWFLQPDANLPGTESLIRHILEGRRWFKKALGVEPRVAYNFDSFGHSGGLPQLLRQAGYEMYIHMRPQPHELALPADLYRWRGVDGTEVVGYRMEVGLYHTERDNIEEKVAAGVDLALRLRRDVPVFWGLGDHGGGATRDDLARIDALIAAARRDDRVPIFHSTPDRFYEAVADAARAAPVVKGDLQRSFTGCYTSLSRLKRRAVESLGTLVQSEAAATAAWWLRGDPVPTSDLNEAWRAHIFNDFHDVLTGSCVEPAERDALDLYGKAADIARRTRLGAAAAFGRGEGEGPALPVAVLNANPALPRAPVEFETMADYRPFWQGTWHLRLFRHDGREIPCQEEPPEPLLPFNDWRRRLSFMDDLPGVGAAHYFLKALPGKDPAKPLKPALPHRFDARTGLVRSLRAGAAGEVLAGPLLDPLAIVDEADSWGTETPSYRRVAGRFRRVDGPRVLKAGPIRTITQSAFEFGKSRIVMDVYAYPAWPVLEFRLRITWNEPRRRLKLRVPTRLAAAAVLVEVPGGAIRRPADGEEHVHGRWLFVEGKVGGRAAALGIASSGQHGFDFQDGELRLSVLRSSAYCHERGFKIERAPARKFADLGVHEVRLIATAGTPADVRRTLPGLADHLARPPFALAHLPYAPEAANAAGDLLSIKPSNIRLLACKPSWDEEALVVRLQEAAGLRTKAAATFGPAPYRVDLDFRPFEVKTLRVERNGVWRECDLITEE